MSKYVDPSPIFRSIIDDVITKSRPEFIQEGVEESVLDELRKLWGEKLLTSGVLTDPAALVAAPAAPPAATHQHLTPAALASMPRPTAGGALPYVTMPYGAAMPYGVPQAGQFAPGIQFGQPGAQFAMQGGMQAAMQNAMQQAMQRTQGQAGQALQLQAGQAGQQQGVQPTLQQQQQHQQRLLQAQHQHQLLQQQARQQQNSMLQQQAAAQHQMQLQQAARTAAAAAAPRPAVPAPAAAAPMMAPPFAGYSSVKAEEPQVKRQRVLEGNAGVPQFDGAGDFTWRRGDGDGAGSSGATAPAATSTDSSLVLEAGNAAIAQASSSHLPPGTSSQPGVHDGQGRARQLSLREEYQLLRQARLAGGTPRGVGEGDTAAAVAGPTGSWSDPSSHAQTVPQRDGDGDDGDDDDGDGDDNEAGGSGAPAAGAAGGDEEDAAEHLTSEEDDKEQEDAEDEAPDFLCAQFEKVQRTKNRWKVAMKDGVFHMNGKDFLFRKATGEFNF